MPTPNEALSTLRPDLGGSFEDFDLEMDRLGFVGYRVLPVLEVQRSAGTFGRIPLEQLLKKADVKRHSRSGYPRGDWEFEQESFATLEYGFEEPVDDRDSALYADFFDAEMVSASIARDQVLRAAEARIAALVFNTTTWTGASLTTAVAAGKEWGTTATTAANATPIDDVEAAVVKVYDGTGMWPNSLIINRKVFRRLRNCDQIIDRIASQGAGSPTKPSDITAQMLAAVFDLDQVLVAGGSNNSANEGQTATPAQIWDSEYAMVARLATTNNIKEPCVGRSFHWGQDGSTIGCTMESYEDQKLRGRVIRARHDVDEMVIEAAFGHLITNVS
jgi:hypothetical protein